MNVADVEIDTSCNKKSTCHLLPVTIKRDGPAKVSAYFEPVISEQQGTLHASFRGKPLLGKTLDVPDGFTGLVASGDEGKFAAKSSFEKFTYWKWDQRPADNDPVKQSLDWLDVSKAIHN